MGHPPPAREVASFFSRPGKTGGTNGPSRGVFTVPIPPPRGLPRPAWEKEGFAREFCGGPAAGALSWPKWEAAFGQKRAKPLKTPATNFSSGGFERGPGGGGHYRRKGPKNWGRGNLGSLGPRTRAKNSRLGNGYSRKPRRKNLAGALWWVPGQTGPPRLNPWASRGGEFKKTKMAWAGGARWGKKPRLAKTRGP